MSKAFDTVWHEGVLSKFLMSWCLWKILWSNIINSFRRNRHQRVCAWSAVVVQVVSHQIADLGKGPSQESIPLLGPLLFLVAIASYINELPNGLLYYNLKLFGDCVSDILRDLLWWRRRFSFIKEKAIMKQ